MDIVHLQLISSMIEYFRGDAKRIQHFIKVYNFAAFLGRQEQIDEETLFILEDAKNKPMSQRKNRPSG